jgi:hypothetical protein
MKSGFARSYTSTWTLSTRRSSSATMRPSRASQWLSAIRPNAASLPQRAMRLGVSAFARRCRQSSRPGSAPNSCLSPQGSMSTAKCPNRFKRSSRTTPPWSNRFLSMRPIWMSPTISRASRLRGKPPRKSGRASTRKPASRPRPEFPAISSSPRSRRTIASRTASSRSCPTKRRPLSRSYQSRSSTA